MALKLLRLPAVLDRCGDSRSTTYQKIADGVFCPPVRIGPRSVAFPEHEVEAILRSRIAGKSQEEIRTLVTQLVAARSSEVTGTTGGSDANCTMTPTDSAAQCAEVA